MNKTVFSTLLVAGVFSLACSQIFAAEPVGKADNFSGFYADLGVGVNINSISTSINNLTLADPTEEGNENYPNSGDKKLSSSPMALQLQGGWGQVFKSNYYYGGFVGVQSANFSKMTTSNTSVVLTEDDSTVTHATSSTLDIKQSSPSFILGAKFGYLLSPKALLWAGLGVSQTTLKLSTTIQPSGSAIVNDGDNYTLSSPTSTIDKSESVVGMSYAVGFKYHFSPRWNGFISDTFTDYKNIDFDAAATTTRTESDNSFVSTIGIKYKQKVSLSTQNIMLGATYRF